MAKNCEEIVKMMDELGCIGDRVTKELIEFRIQEVDYQTIVIAGQKMMYCGIRMDNGFVAVGKPATCIDPKNWRDEIGQKISYDNSFEELWRLEAYRKMSVPSEYEIAKVAHEVNRAYCQSIGDDSQLKWDDAPEWQKSSAIYGVTYHLDNPDATPEQSHDSWLSHKRGEGWKYGPVKDVGKKEHPCFKPYSDLPESQKAKDYLFRQIVHSLKCLS